MARFYCFFCDGVVIHCIHVPPLLYSSVDGHLGCFHILAVVNNAEVNQLSLIITNKNKPQVVLRINLEQSLAMSLQMETPCQPSGGGGDYVQGWCLLFSAPMSLLLTYKSVCWFSLCTISFYYNFIKNDTRDGWADIFILLLLYSHHSQSLSETAALPLSGV